MAEIICQNCKSKLRLTDGQPVNVYCLKCGGKRFVSNREIKLTCFFCNETIILIPEKVIEIGSCRKCRGRVWIPSVKELLRRSTNEEKQKEE